MYHVTASIGGVTPATVNYDHYVQAAIEINRISRAATSLVIADEI